jgi:PRC-barrel domain
MRVRREGGRRVLRNVKELLGFAIHATDGTIGEVADLYFDDEDWAIRYLVVDTGHWLSSRKVLISPVAIGQVDWMAQQLSVSLTKARVEGSPDIDTRKPVSRQHEAAYLGYYGLPLLLGRLGFVGHRSVPAQPDDRTRAGR